MSSAVKQWDRSNQDGRQRFVAYYYSIVYNTGIGSETDFCKFIGKLTSRFKQSVLECDRNNGYFS